jgi:hypothetical protein
MSAMGLENYSITLSLSWFSSDLDITIIDVRILISYDCHNGGFRGTRMPKIMIRCSTFGTPVPTGLTTEAIKFDSLSGIEIPMQCPACLKNHKWERKDAWIDGAVSKQ